MKDYQRTERRLLPALLLGAAVSAAAMGASSMLFAVLIKKQILSEDMLRIWTIVICAVGTVMGCLTAQAGARRARLPICLGCCAMTLALLAILRMILGVNGNWTCHTALTAAVCAVGCALFGAGRGS